MMNYRDVGFNRRIFARYRLRTSRVIILDQIYPVAHLEPPHQVGVERLQQVGRVPGLGFLPSVLLPSLGDVR